MHMYYYLMFNERDNSVDDPLLIEDFLFGDILFSCYFYCFVNAK